MSVEKPSTASDNKNKVKFGLGIAAVAGYAAFTYGARVRNDVRNLDVATFDKEMSIDLMVRAKGIQKDISGKIALCYEERDRCDEIAVQKFGGKNPYHFFYAKPNAMKECSQKALACMKDIHDAL